MKKTISLLLALLLASLTFASCSDNPKESDNSSESSSDTPAESDVPDEISHFDQMPAENFGGWTYNIAGGHGTASEANGICEHITMEEYVGDDFNDKLYERMVNIQSKYNVKIQTHYFKYAEDPIITSVKAGSGDFFTGCVLFNRLSETIISGYAIDLATLNFDFNDPWWDKGAVDTLMINGKIFHGLGMIGFSAYESCSVLYYNGQLLENNQIKESPYDLWKEGKWTLDAMALMTESVASDRNNDNKFTPGDDVFGLLGRTLSHIPAVFSSGLSLTTWDEEEMLVKADFIDEDLMAVGNMLKKIWRDSEFNGEWDEDEANTLFKANKAFLLSRLLGDFRELRDKDDNYGIIVWPSLKENTEIKVAVRNPTTVIVTSDVTGEIKHRVETLLEAMNTYAYDYIFEDYIKLAVIAGSSRDAESAEVVRYSLDNKAYNTEQTFGLDSIVENWFNVIDTGLYASTNVRLQRTLPNRSKTFIKVYYGDEAEE
ncbi:MAG: hypothetical protein E7672_00710 [Ruminococcaceae bacterium]|nr:hypothetical protein [Oscillospiraceae bacterium]